MRRLSLIFLSFIVVLLVPSMVLASDISLAKYYGIITTYNEGAAITTGVVGTFNLNTHSLIDAGYINSEANNTVICNTSGSDVPFMPSVNSSYPWAFWIPGIAEDDSISYLFYTNATGGDICYFPDVSGMTVADNNSLELSDTFTIEMDGRIKAIFTDNYSGRNLVYKQGAFRIYVPASGNITAQMTCDNISPTSYSDNDSVWYSWTSAYDRNIDTGAYTYTTNKYLALYPSSVPLCSNIGIYASQEQNGGSFDPSVSVDVYYSGSWHNIKNGVITKKTWTVLPIGSSQYVTGIRVKSNDFLFYNDPESFVNLTIYEMNLVLTSPTRTVSAVCSSDNHTVEVSADGPDLVISIDGATSGDGYDSVPLDGAKVIDNDNNWFFCQNGVMIFLKYLKVWKYL